MKVKGFDTVCCKLLRVNVVPQKDFMGNRDMPNDQVILKSAFV